MSSSPTNAEMHCLIVLPTYNERENVLQLIAKIEQVFAAAEAVPLVQMLRGLLAPVLVYNLKREAASYIPRRP